MELYHLQNEHLKISVSDFGAELKSLFCKRSMREWMWQAHPEFWPRTSPVLFPIVGKLKDNELRFRGDKYSLPQHGFARDREFRIVSSEENALQFQLKSDEQTARQFPFSFVLDIRYEILDSVLRVAYRVQNPGQDVLHFSIGAHPGFSLPGFPDKSYQLEFQKEEALHSITLKDGLLDFENLKVISDSAYRLVLTTELFLDDALVFAGLQSEWIGIRENPEGPQLRLHAAGFPFMGIWSKPGAPFVCIEPWHGHADPFDFQRDFDQKPAIRQLISGAVFECSFSIELIPQA